MMKSKISNIWQQKKITHTHKRILLTPKQFHQYAQFLILLYFIRNLPKLGYRFDMKSIEVIRLNDVEAICSAEH